MITKLRRSLPIALAAAITVGGIGACGDEAATREEPRAVSRTSVDLPDGFKAASYDAARDSIWVLTRSTDTLNVVLTEVSAADGQTLSETVVGKDRGTWGRGAVHVATDGAVWLGFGRQIVRVTPGSVAPEEWATPDEWSAIGDGGLGGRLYGMAIIAPGTVAAVAVGAPRVGFLDTTAANSKWEMQPLPPGATVDAQTTVAALSAGRVLIDAAAAAGRRALVALSASGAADVSVADSRGVAAAEGDPIIALTDGSFTRYSRGLAAFVARGEPTIEAAQPLATGRGFAWQVRPGEGVMHLANWKTDASRQPAILEFPTVTGTLPGRPGINGPIPGRTVMADPDIEALAVDGSGGVWVFTMFGRDSQPAPYASVYRLPALAS